jgi:hypothetical protein
MQTKLKKILILIVFLQVLLPTRVAMADLGPKPTMDFIFTQEFSGDQVTITSGILLKCEQPDCSDGQPLEKLGPQEFSCEGYSCHALAYGFSTYHRLKIQFSDGRTRQSNVFETSTFSGNYTVTVRQDDLFVKTQDKVSSNPFLSWTYLLLCAGCLLTVIILVVGVILIVRWAVKRK